jgi:ferredoxin
MTPKPRLGIDVDRDICAGTEDCADTLPRVFSIDHEGKSQVNDSNGGSADEVLEAARNCPVLAILVWDAETGERLGP